MVIFSNPESVARWPDAHSIRTLGVTFLLSLAIHATLLFLANADSTAVQLPIPSSSGRISVQLASWAKSAPRPQPKVGHEIQKSQTPEMRMASVAAVTVDPVTTQSAQLADAVSSGESAEGIQEMRVAVPMYSHNPPPEYPLDARRRFAEGTVLLRVRISETGGVVSVSVDKSGGYSSLDAAAQQAVQRWKFVPASRGSTPIQSVCVVPIEFSLKKGVSVK